MTTTSLPNRDSDTTVQASAMLDGLTRNSALALEEAAAALDLEAWIVERLRHPVEKSTSYLQLFRDAGDAICLPLFQVQHGTSFGSTLGSLSLCPDLQLPSCEAMAMERSWQAALLGLPFGGASYGLVCDPDQLSERELMRLLGAAAERWRLQPGGQAVLLPGGGCRRECMAKLFAETQERGKLIVTGKPDCLAGLDLDHFQAESVAAVIATELRRLGKTPAKAKVAIQGFGPLGQSISERLTSEGLTLVALSDNAGALYRADGLILDDIRSRYRRQPILFGYSEAEPIRRADLLHLKCDVLVLTSGPNEVHDRNWSAISAPLVVEADWNAVTAAAQDHLAVHKIRVMPWLISTAGALLGAWFESREAQIDNTPEGLLAKTHACIEQLLAKVERYPRDKQESLDRTARRLAVERSAQCLRLCAGKA